MKELSLIQARLKVPKTRENISGGFNFRHYEDILLAVKPFLAEFDCSLKLSDTLESAVNQIYIKATATLTNSQGVTESAEALARDEITPHVNLTPGQLTGAASAYARKGALCGLFLIDNNSDPDAREVDKIEEVKEKRSRMRKKQTPEMP